MHLEIVTHCWNYSRLLTYQLSSLTLAPPRELQVDMSVFYCEDDSPTKSVIEFFCGLTVPGIRWNPRPVPVDRLLCRGIGRNDAAKSTRADWVWFADADYCFLEGCLDSLASSIAAIPSDREARLLFPRFVQTHRSPELGDVAIEAASGPPRLVTVRPEEFEPQVMTRAIGGIQICHGDVARDSGYCPGHRRYRRSLASWQRTTEDVGFRRSLGTRGMAIDVHNLFRIRHSRRGYLEAGVVL